MRHSSKMPGRCQSKPTKVSNPLQAGIMNFQKTKTGPTSFESKDIPKRYTRYGSMLLLGPTFPTHSPPWITFFESLTPHDRSDLYQNILLAFHDSSLTHIAINAPITTHSSNSKGDDLNVIRSPTGLQPVYGDFGLGPGECNDRFPSNSDLDSAYWTQTIQLNNIVQMWAPRWTMFSRGNISEKARILQADATNRPFPGLSDEELGEAIKNIDVVDFYVGIGYFAFCYLTRGVARVWGWDVNGWSVEGLRRGCVANGWKVRTVTVDEDGRIADGSSLQNLVNEIASLQDTPDAIRCIVFLGDNQWASHILGEIDTLMKVSNENSELNIRHCNLGLLPSSENSWDHAVQVLNRTKGGWLHVHENVEFDGIEAKQENIVERLEYISHRVKGPMWSAFPCHAEQVKTYAPGVVHCVYDIKLYPSR